MDLANVLRFAKSKYNLDILDDFLNATPAAELEPITKDYVQSDGMFKSLEWF